MIDIESKRLQFRVLRRQFLFRVVEIEALSTHAQGDATKLLGQFVALLFFASLVLSLGLLGLNGVNMTPTARFDFCLSMEHFLIATTMLAVGIFAVLSWDSIFPDHHDVLVLAPLPVSPRTIFLAKGAATATGLALVVVALNAAAGLGWPLAFAGLATPSSHWLIAAVRYFAAYWLTILTAGAFIYCGLLSAQGLAAQILPRRLFLQVSGLLQTAALCLFISGYFLEPGVAGLKNLVSPAMQRPMFWLPTYWFFGLYNELAGSMRPVLQPLARRAWVGLAITTLTTAVVYALSYMRTMKQMLEEPNISFSPRGLRWLPPFGNRLQTAIAHFVVRSLARSRQHRLILAFYLGIGLAFTILLVQVLLQPHRPGNVQAVPATELWRERVTPVLAASIMMIILAVIGTRVAFAFPLDLSANWIFRAVGTRPGAEIPAATRRALLFLSVMPVWLGSAVAMYLKSWPWPEAAAHLLFLALLGSILADLVLYNFRKIPFTCSYLPGKSQAWIVLMAAAALLLLVAHGVVLERQLLEKPEAIIDVLLLGAAVAGALRWYTAISTRLDEGELQFEEVDSSALLDLGLSRDGGTIGTHEP